MDREFEDSGDCACGKKPLLSSYGSYGASMDISSVPENRFDGSKESAVGDIGAPPVSLSIISGDNPGAVPFAMLKNGPMLSP